ncbi:MAG: LSM domain-containing protein [Promethearchaeota archaeon]
MYKKFKQKRYYSHLTSKLKYFLGKELFISIKIRNHFIKGILREFDQHLNLIIDNAKEIEYRSGENREIEKQYGKIIIRGDSIIYIDFKHDKSEIMFVDHPGKLDTNVLDESEE